MADVAIWSRLPPVLLPIIIENTTDIPTLEAWCQLTRHSPYLHRIAKRETYRTFKIGMRAFLKPPPSPSNAIVQERAISPDDAGQDHGESYAIDNEIENNSDIAQADASLPLSEFYRENASHVKRLVLDLEFLDLERAEDLVATPRSDGFDSIWGGFLFHASCLDEVEHHGILYQSMFERLTIVPTLRVLKLREVWTRSRNPHRRRETDYFRLVPTPLADLLISWPSLIRLPLLRTLHVSHLFLHEAMDLAIVVRCLLHLKDLRVAVSSLSLPGGNSIRSDDPSPLVIFLQSLYRPLTPNFIGFCLGIPPALEKLALVDFYSQLTSASLQCLGSIESLGNLTHLHLDFLIGSATVHLIDILNPHRLTHLSMSTLLTTNSHSLRMRFQEVLARHRDTLQQITLVNAWLNFQPYSPKIDPPWCSFMESTQLYLARHPKTPFFTNANNLHWCIFGTLEPPSKWGTTVRHVCIDQIDLEHMHVNRIDDPADGLQRLRVLVLRPLPLPRQLHSPQTSMPTPSLPHPHEPMGPPLPADIDALLETAIAKAIAAQALPCLRLIAVGRYRFWIQSPDTPDATGSREIWFLRRALQDPRQEEEISRALDADDWAFLADRSDGLADPAPDEMVRLANRIVYRRIQD